MPLGFLQELTKIEDREVLTEVLRKISQKKPSSEKLRALIRSYREERKKTGS